MTSKIQISNACVDFPVFNAGARSLKNQVVSIATGGGIKLSDQGVVTVNGLKDINLTINEGERVGFVGHNGAGKTTMLRLLSGIYEPTTGEAAINGQAISLIDIGLGIDPEATGYENIRLRAAIMGMSRKELSQRYDEVAEFTGLGDFLKMPFRTYSTGMKLRLAFSISTAITPDILVMDEWLSTGDEDFRQKADQRLHSLVASTPVLILASHSRELLESNCNRIIWLEHGQIKMDGSPGEILPQYFV